MATRVESPITREVIRRALEGRARNPLNAVIAVGLLAALLASLAILAVLLIDTVIKAMPVLQERGLSFVGAPLSPRPEAAGIFQGIMGSLALTAFVIVIAFPLGVAAAIYMEEYAPDNRTTRFITANIRNLAGVPSIVYGILGFTIFVKVLYQSVLGQDFGRVVVAGGLTLAVLVLPIMIITSSEALRAVPQELREASMGVGATRWETIRHHVLPVAIPAILTGSVLTVARAFGESAPLLLAGAQLSLFFSTASDAGLFGLVSNQPYTALPIIIYNFARQPQEEFVALTAAAIIVLLVMLLSVNAAAIVARDRFERRAAR
jgi:phosphate transport system permease protein